MKTRSEEVFACYEKACAPPPAGKGGSLKGGPGGGGSPHTPALVKAVLKGKASNLSQDGTTNTNRPGGIGGGSAGSGKKKEKKVSPHTGKPYSKSNPPPDFHKVGGGKVMTWKEEARLRRDPNWSEWE